MNIVKTEFADVVIIEPIVYSDNRGYFMESFREEIMNEIISGFHPVQDNQSLSKETGVLRGLHYQMAPKGQAKLIRVLSGAIYDVVVDIRKGSKTYGKWQGFELSADNFRQLYVPKGFLHGFCTLQPDTIVFYKTDEYYSPAHDRGVLWNDPAIAVKWPIKNPILSVKDLNNPLLADAENNFVWGE